MMISPAQCRAARALLGWSQDDLAQAGAVAKATVANFEAAKRTPYGRTLDDLIAALEAAGVEFIPENGGGPGVRLRQSSRRADDHPKPVGPATDAVEAMESAISRDKSRPGETRLASVKETGEEIPQDQWERFEAADKKPKR